MESHNFDLLDKYQFISMFEKSLYEFFLVKIRLENALLGTFASLLGLFEYRVFDTDTLMFIL